MHVPNPRYERWPANPSGRDYVVGDVHGCYRTLEEILRRERFDAACDRLFAVGDLINRGPHSAETTKWLATGRLSSSVLGNHDAAVRESLLRAPYHPRVGWLGTLDPAERIELAKALDLPLGIELETAHGLVGIVHAGVVRRDWVETRRLIEDGNPYTIAHVLFGGRTPRWWGQPGTPIAGVELLVTGHAPLARAESDGYWHRIDTGAGLSHLNRLTLLEVTSRPTRRITLPVTDPLPVRQYAVPWPAGP